MPTTQQPPTTGRLRPLAIAAILAPALTGCGLFGPPTGPAPVVATPIKVPTPDGSYQGRGRLVLAAAPDCPPARYGVAEIGDRQLVYAYTPGIVFRTLVADDGSIHQRVRNVTLDGKVAGDHLSLTISSPSCRTVYSMNFIWNHS